MIGSRLPDVHVVPKPKQIPQEPIHTVIATHNDLDISKLNRYIEGSSWSVIYYNQLRAENDQNQVIDTSSIASVQQYEKIINLELKVTSPIEPTNFSDVTGEATIYVDITPKEGDVFTAMLDAGRIALFRVDEVVHELYNLNTIYKITYRLSAFYDNTSEDFITLENKVVREFVYDTTFTSNENCILTKNDYITKIDLLSTLKELQRYYVNTFFNSSTRTLLLPGMTKTMDPYNECFIFSIFNYDSLLMGELNRFAIDKADFLFNTIYDILLKKKVKSIKHLKDPFYVENKFRYTKSPILKTGRYYNVEFIVSRGDNKSDLAFFGDTLLDNLETSYDSNGLLPDRHEERHWIFSENFYSKLEYKSIIEKLTLDYLHNRQLSLEELSDLVDDYMNWSPLDQFYYIPILVMLLKYKTTETYSPGV